MNDLLALKLIISSVIQLKVQSNKILEIPILYFVIKCLLPQ